MKKFICTCALAGLIVGCTTPAENAEQVDSPSSTDNDNKTVEVQPPSENDKEEEVVTKMLADIDVQKATMASIVDEGNKRKTLQTRGECTKNHR